MKSSDILSILDIFVWYVLPNKANAMQWQYSLIAICIVIIIQLSLRYKQSCLCKTFLFMCIFSLYMCALCSHSFSCGILFFYFWYSQKEVGKSNTEALSEDSKVTQNIITAVIFTCIQLHNLHAINKWILLFSKSASNWSKVRVLIMLQKICTSNKCFLFNINNPGGKQFPQKY